MSEIKIPRYLLRSQFMFDQDHKYTFEMKNRRILRLHLLPFFLIFQETFSDSRFGIFLILFT